jgi:hypothetical protein
MYYNEAMTETTVRPDASRVRTVRMYDDAWDLIGDRAPDHSRFIRDMMEAGVDAARCYRCFELVPVEFGDLTGKPIAEWVAEAGKIVTAQHRQGHHPVTIGNGVGPEPKAAPGSAVFLEPGGKPVIAAAVPEVPASRKGRR